VPPLIPESIIAMQGTISKITLKQDIFKEFWLSVSSTFTLMNGLPINIFIQMRF